MAATLREKIRAVQEQVLPLRKLTFKAWCDAARIPPQTVTKYLRYPTANPAHSSKEISYEKALLLAEKAGVSPRWFLGGTTAIPELADTARMTEDAVPRLYARVDELSRLVESLQAENKALIDELARVRTEQTLAAKKLTHGGFGAKEERPKTTKKKTTRHKR